MYFNKHKLALIKYDSVFFNLEFQYIIGVLCTE